MTAGSCFGFEPKSELGFRFLRSGGGSPLLVRLRDDEPTDLAAGHPPLLEWSLPGPEPLHVRLHRRRDRYDLWVEGGGWFTVDPVAPAIDVPATGDPTRREERLWGLPALLCFWARGDFALHAAAVEIGGGAVLLAAPGRFGKTTLAASFLAAGHRVLSEDLSCCRLGEDPLLFPGPALLKVRRDSYERLALPDVSVVAEDRERVHLAIGAGRSGDAAAIPLRAVVLLHEAGATPTLERIAPADAVQQLWVLAFNMPTDDDRARCFGNLVELCRSVPVWRLHRPFTFEDLPGVVDHLASAFGG